MIITNTPGGVNSDILCNITVTWPSGSTCTATCGSTVLQGGTSGSTVFGIKKAGTWTIYCTNGTDEDSEDVVVATQAKSVTLNYYPVKAFSACTMAEIKQICDDGNAATYVNNGTWTIGDTNTNATYGSYSGIRLVHVLTDTQRGSDYYGTNGHIVVEFVNTITTSEWHSSYSTQTSYSAATILSTLNTIYSSGINSELRAVLSSFAPSTSVQSSSSTSAATTSVEHPSGYLHVPNCVEVGSTNSYRPSENDKSFCFTYYSDSSTATSRRIKSGANTCWWLRSPS